MTAIDSQQCVTQEDLKVLLKEKTPLLPEKVLRSFVESFFSRKSDFLSALQTLQSPLYLFEPEVLLQRSKRFQAAFNEHFENTGFYYAVKSNNYPEIAKILTQTGFGLDVSSGLELEMALSLKAKNIIFSGPGKNKVELEKAVGASEQVTLLIDSFHELKTLGQITFESTKDIRVGVRLTTKPEGLWRKFGILPEELPRFLQEINFLPHVHFQGIQFHTSWNLNAQAQVDFILTLSDVLGQLSADDLEQITFIDIGGGYWPEQGEWLQPAGTKSGLLRKALESDQDNSANHYYQKAHSIEEFAEQLSWFIKKHILSHIPSCRICFEPGRWICNDIMHILMTVVDKKSHDLVITDAGTNAIGWERFETDYFPVLNLSRPDISEKACNILGSLCTPHDVWGYNYWGNNIEIGDVLMIPTQGAYTYSLKQNFIKPLPQVAHIPPASTSHIL